MKQWAIIVAVAVALFCAGRLAHRAHAGRATAPAATATGAAPAGVAPTPGSSAARRAAMQTFLAHLAHTPRPAAARITELPAAMIERSITEPPDITAKRRARASAEIDERAPGLPVAKRKVLLAEADRLAWDKRQLRAAFLEGQLSEADYVAALKDDIRASLADFEETLTADEYVALFNRRPGSDPFAVESFIGHPADKQLAP